MVQNLKMIPAISLLIPSNHGSEERGRPTTWSCDDRNTPRKGHQSITQTPSA